MAWAAWVSFAVLVALLIPLYVYNTKQRHRQGRSMWEKNDLPWRINKRDQANKERAQQEEALQNDPPGA